MQQPLFQAVSSQFDHFHYNCCPESLCKCDRFDGFRKLGVNTEAPCEVDTLVETMGYAEIRLFLDF